MMTRVEFLQKALIALGEAYRGDWSGVDGREIRSELEELARFLDEDHPLPSFEQWLQATGIKEDEYGYGWIW